MHGYVSAYHDRTKKPRKPSLNMSLSRQIETMQPLNNSEATDSSTNLIVGQLYIVITIFIHEQITEIISTGYKNGLMLLL